MRDKKLSEIKSPNTSKMQEVIIDARTKIYIDADADPVAAKKRFLERVSARNPEVNYGRKPNASKA